MFNTQVRIQGKDTGAIYPGPSQKRDLHSSNLEKKIFQITNALSPHHPVESCHVCV